MSESIHRFITAGYAVSIDFTKQGRRQFAKVNRSLGRRYIRAFILKRDLAEYQAEIELQPHAGHSPEGSSQRLAQHPL